MERRDCVRSWQTPDDRPDEERSRIAGSGPAISGEVPAPGREQRARFGEKPLTLFGEFGNLFTAEGRQGEGILDRPGDRIETMDPARGGNLADRVVPVERAIGPIKTTARLDKRSCHAAPATQTCRQYPGWAVRHACTRCKFADPQK